MHAGNTVCLSPRPSCASGCPPEVAADDCFALVMRLRHWNIAHAITSAANRGMMVAKAMRTEVFGDVDGEVEFGTTVPGAATIRSRHINISYSSNSPIHTRLALVW